MPTLKSLFVLLLLPVVGMMSLRLLGEPAPRTLLSPQPVQAAAQVVTLPMPVRAPLYDLAPGQWRCEFYANRDLMGAPAFTQTLPVAQATQPTLNLNWGLKRPSGLIPADNFSARCRSRWQMLLLSIYTLRVVANDGVRLLVDDVLVLDGWHNGQQTEVVHVPLQAGPHEVAVEYFEATGAAKLALNMQEGCDAWTGRYYPNSNFGDVPMLIDCNGAAQGPLGFDMNDGFPRFMNGVDVFSVWWEQNVRFAARGTYQFQIDADDGAEVYIGDQRVYARLNDSIGRDTFVADVGTGVHQIQVRYADRGGAARFSMSWERVG